MNGVRVVPRPFGWERVVADRVRVLNGGEGRDEGGQLFAPLVALAKGEAERHILNRSEEIFVHPRCGVQDKFLRFSPLTFDPSL
jgi:hypothetical protein